MYRLVLYCLIALLAVAGLLSALHLLPYNPFSILFLSAFITLFCWVANKVFAAVFEVPANVESVYITALILALIITPPRPTAYASSLMFLFWVSVIAMASKFILAVRRKHFFNPAAFAVAITAIAIGQGASWWVGTQWMLPAVLITGLLITRKIQRFDLVISFFAAALIVTLATTKGAILLNVNRVFLQSAFFFFAFIMLTEPLTTPPSRRWRIVYGVLTGILFAPAVHIGSIYSTPELALVVGNIFSYIVSPKSKYLLSLFEKERIGSGTYDFVLEPDRNVSFEPGQYLEWTLKHNPSDSRGNRRYFTIASSPTEKHLRLGVKFAKKSSTYKEAMLEMSDGSKILAGSLSGDFVLPKDKKQKLVFVAGGIGITPYRSMLKYLVDKREKRDIVVIYSNRNFDEIVYTDVLQEANDELGTKILFTLTDKDHAPEGWRGYRGYINKDIISREIPDFRDRTFYLSGSHTMVVGFENTLKSLGVSALNIKKDFFPGL